MQVGDWVYCEELDETLKVLATTAVDKGIVVVLLQVGPNLWVASSACEKMTTSECGYCHEQKPHAKQERYSAGCYAGRMCDDCAYSRYRDHCGVDGTPQLTQADCDEPIEPEPCIGGF